ncbi:hypothetical protein EOI86_05405 [Hwanghaeella grinnelliae]|uniref:Molybdopterin-guanine dinucleotide biosynthesis protein A n=1 Tax=Hwanghaeella grinnelliae TaxID=2500179 RepID=A0A437QW04_9PROT|nr:hypothetical protein [Hwanghaeella grinnelliae]RVU38710.1 hypothetical protein EOI86_05405 [Hwanghaeella grinnelliae]
MTLTYDHRAERRFTCRPFAVLFLVCAVLASLTGAGDAAQAESKHEGYYYPPPSSEETYVARVDTMPEANRRTRIAFVTGLTAQQSQSAYPPTYHLFAKGDGAQKFILVSVDRDKYSTLYQLRALLAAMTALTRNTPLFQDSAMPENLTFLDLCKLMGVQEIVVSNGVAVAHRINIK